MEMTTSWNKTPKWSSSCEQELPFILLNFAFTLVISLHSPFIISILKGCPHILTVNHKRGHSFFFYARYILADSLIIRSYLYRQLMKQPCCFSCSYHHYGLVSTVTCWADLRLLELWFGRYLLYLALEYSQFYPIISQVKRTDFHC